MDRQIQEKLRTAAEGHKFIDFPFLMEQNRKPLLQRSR